MSNELEVKAPEMNLPALPEAFSEENLNKFYKQVEDEVKGEVFDVTTEDGRKRIKKVAADINKSKTTIDAPMRDYLRVLKAQPKVLEGLARESKLKYENLRESVLEPLTEAQKYQDELLAWLNGIPAMCADPLTTSPVLKETQRSIDNVDRSQLWPELQKKFKVAFEAAETSVKVTLERVEAAEAQAAELKRLQEEAAKREQEEHDRKVAEQAKLQAQQEAEAKAKAEKEAIERRAVEAKQREESARLAAEQAKQAAIDAENKRLQEAEEAKKREAQAKIDAEKRAKEQAEQAAKAERDRIAAEEAEHKRLAAEREADKDHRIKINRAALCALVAGGLSEEDAKKVITMIAKGQVPNIQIFY